MIKKDTAMTTRPTTPHAHKAEDAQEFDISETRYKTSHTAVRKARRFALQGLYEWLLTDYHFDKTGEREHLGNSPHDIAARTRATNAMHTVHLGYYHELMHNIPAQVGELSVLIGEKLVDRTLPRLDPVEFATLLIGAYELKTSLHIPYKVVIDEAISLNAHFGSSDGYKLINAVMDKLARELRADEIASDKADTPAAKLAPKAPNLG